ncbi:signaling protein [Roseibium sp. TrichSKD4]|uniref:GGDEF domain-containing protein n=1 Tax=Roseibium sp. TrichSKD4 TaxID=744980 RepID=UPI0001E572C4|nr:GGDEF domain-containing protein [Roseibium sp. TrichSKD4]EFO29108.1 signaling protein [Roseibium sp. TrichSKD4]
MKLNTKTLTGQWSLMRSALVIVLFVVGMIFTQITINTAVTEFDRREFYSARLEEVGQFGWEYRTFFETAIAIAKGEDWATRKDMNRALDIFWSRTHTLAQADYIEAYDDQDKAQLIVNRLKDDLPNFEKAANAIVEGKPETAADLEKLYFAHRQEVLNLAQAAYHKRRNKAASALEAQFEATNMLKSLNIALGAGGLLGFLYLLFELFRSMKLARKLHETNRKVREVAETDFLTGLYNRRAFSEHLEKLQADDQTSEFNLLLLDLDGFKPINDRLGHVAGDLVLKEIGKRLKSLADASLIARLGGDEFALVVDGPQDIAAELAEKVIEVISARIDYEGATVSITGSIGITTSDRGQYRTMSDLMHEADLALYEAKGRGRRQSCFYHPSMASELRRRV